MSHYDHLDEATRAHLTKQYSLYRAEIRAKASQAFKRMRDNPDTFSLSDYMDSVMQPVPFSAWLGLRNMVNHVAKDLGDSWFKMEWECPGELDCPQQPLSSN